MTFLQRLVASILTLASLTSEARAQSAPTPEEVHQAQARWAEGKAAFDARNYEAARVAFKQAYTIFQHPAFLQNLGEAELRTGRMVEAARHLTLFLRATSTGSPAQREFAKKSLRRAAEKLGSVVVESNVEEAEIRVDGELIGLTPLAGLAWHVNPGQHLVTGHKDGFLDGSERVPVAAGAPTPVLLRLQRVMASTVDIAQTQERTADPPAASPPVEAPPPVRRDASTSRPIQARTVVLVAGSVITVVAAGLGVGFTLRVNDDLAARDNASKALSSLGEDTQRACIDPAPNAQFACRTLVENASRLRTDRIMQFIGFIGAGVVGAGTLATFFVWQPAPTRAASVFPVLGPDYAGVRWLATF